MQAASLREDTHGVIPFAGDAIQKPLPKMALYSLATELIELCDERDAIAQQLEEASGADVGLGDYVETAAELTHSLAVAEGLIQQYIGAVREKADNIAEFVEFLEAYELRERKKANLHTQRARRAEATRERIRANVVGVMRAIGAPKIQGEESTLRIQKNNPKAEVVGNLPPSLMRATVQMPLSVYLQLYDAVVGPTLDRVDVTLKEVEPQMKQILTALKAGPVPGARVAEDSFHLRIA